MRTTTDEERVSYPYQRYTITTLRDWGVWWAKARVQAGTLTSDRRPMGRDALTGEAIQVRLGQIQESAA